MQITATRRIQFCSGHRVYNHESKCKNLHGHNYILHVTCEVTESAKHDLRGDLDSLGRVIDFSVIKDRIGNWIDRHWDHGTIFWSDDKEMLELFIHGALKGHKSYALPVNPTAENMASYLLKIICPALFVDTDVFVQKIVLEETENCSVEVSL